MDSADSNPLIHVSEKMNKIRSLHNDCRIRREEKRTIIEKHLSDALSPPHLLPTRKPITRRSLGPGKALQLNQWIQASVISMDQVKLRAHTHTNQLGLLSSPFFKTVAMPTQEHTCSRTLFH